MRAPLKRIRKANAAHALLEQATHVRSRPRGTRSSNAGRAAHRRRLAVRRRAVRHPAPRRPRRRGHQDRGPDRRRRRRAPRAAVRGRRRLALLPVVQPRQEVAHARSPASRRPARSCTTSSASAHAVYNNLRGDLPAKLGLTYAALREVNPAVVCCSLSGFGATGPRAAEPAFDYLIQGYAGWMSVTGEPDGPPGKCGVSVVDFAGGYASMAALHDRPVGRAAHRRRARHRRLAARHRGQHAVLLRDLDAEPRLAGRPRGRLRPPVAGARAELPDARRLDRRLLQQGEVLAEPRGRAGAARASAATRASPPSPTASRTRTR